MAGTGFAVERLLRIEEGHAGILAGGYADQDELIGRDHVEGGGDGVAGGKVPEHRGREHHGPVTLRSIDEAEVAVELRVDSLTIL